MPNMKYRQFDVPLSLDMMLGIVVAFQILSSFWAGYRKLYMFLWPHAITRSCISSDVLIFSCLFNHNCCSLPSTLGGCGFGFKANMHVFSFFSSSDAALFWKRTLKH